MKFQHGVRGGMERAEFHLYCQAQSNNLDLYHLCGIDLLHCMEGALMPGFCLNFAYLWLSMLLKWVTFLGEVILSCCFNGT